MCKREKLLSLSWKASLSKFDVFKVRKQCRCSSALGRGDGGPSWLTPAHRHSGRGGREQRQRRRPSCCHHHFLTEAALYLLHHCLQLGGHHPALINGSVHWEGAKHTHAPLHIQKDICARLPKRLTHTKDLPLLPSPLETDKKGSFLVFHKAGAMQGREHTLSKSADLIHPLTDTMRRGRLQEMGRLCPRKDFLQAVNGKLT